MKKIAHLQLLPYLTGVQRVSLDELTRLNDKVFDKYIICQGEGLMTEEAVKHGIKCHYIPTLVRSISPLNDLKSFIAIYKICKKNKFDIVHTHSSKTGVIGRLAAKLARVPMVVHTVHGFAFPAAKNNRQKLLYFFLEWLGTKCSDKIICLHDDDRLIAKKYLGADNNKLLVMPNGVNLNRYEPPSAEVKERLREKLGIPNDVIVIGMNGRLWEQKNPQLLLHSALEILNHRDNVCFIFTGDGELRSELESIINNANLQNKVTLLGWRNDIEDVLKTLDIFVLPSLWEGMPLAIIEAQATGLPCVVSNISGNNHLVQHGVNGLLFDLKCTDELTNNLVELIDNPSKRKVFGDNAIAEVRKNFDVDIRIKNISKLYSEFLS